MKIFISHSSKDKLIVDTFVENILISGCGIPEKSIFCTSIEGLGIKNGTDFRQHILDELLDSDYSFLLISDNYKKSDICLNEMGASWAIKDLNVKPFIFPNVNFNSIGTLYSVKQVSKLNDSFALDELFEELTSKYNTKRPITRWNKYKSTFIDQIEKFKNHELITSNFNPDDFFGKFINENASLNNIFLKAHPTLLDCKAVFSKDYYVRMFKIFCSEFEKLTNNNLDSLYPNYTSYKFETNTTIEMISGKNRLAGGMAKSAEKGALNYDVTFYSVTFLKNNSEKFGTSFSVFCYIQDRWVFFPKPWRGIL